MTDLETQLKEAIEASGMNQPQLSELSGVNQGQISRFMSGERSLTLKSASKIAKELKLELKPKGRKRG